MRLRAAHCALLFMLIGLTSQVGVAGEKAPWPQFRGPDGSGIAEDEKPPVEIGPETNVKWKPAVPAGLSSPVLTEELVLLTGFEDEQLLTLAYRRDNGELAWKAAAKYESIEPYHSTEGSPAASTPATDGELVVSYFGSCGLVCYDLTGKELWTYELPPAATVADFGTGVSPILVDGVVVLLHDDTKNPMILAVDAKDGTKLWEKKRESISGFGTPAVWRTEDSVQIVAPGSGRMIGYDLKTGEELWFVVGMPSACCTTPVVLNNRLYFAGWSPGGSGGDDGDFTMPTFDEILAMNNADANNDGIYSKEEAAGSPFENFFDNNDPNKDGMIVREEWDAMLAQMQAGVNSAFALTPGGKGDITESNVLWKQTRGLPYVPSAILYRDQFILIKDGGIITAYDAATGKQTSRSRAAAPGEYYSSPVAANGKLYFTSLKDGVVTVLEPNGNSYREVKKNEPFNERISATPAIDDNTLYLRTATTLYAFQE